MAPSKICRNNITYYRQWSAPYTRTTLYITIYYFLTLKANSFKLVDIDKWLGNYYHYNKYYIIYD